MSLSYRPEIDGLRAIAVTAVVLFHSGLVPLHGGFAGVDVFFVISGFLVTAILLKDMRNGHYSILQFYERRVRRILPALAVVRDWLAQFDAKLSRRRSASSGGGEAKRHSRPAP